MIAIKTLRLGTVILSNPKGEKASANVATMATPIETITTL